MEVFQPFELVAGAGSLDGLPQVRDGDTQLVLSIRRLAPEAQVVFTIDVDDTLGSRGITVAGSEIEGAIVRVAAAGASFSARFTREADAVVATPACV